MIFLKFDGKFLGLLKLSISMLIDIVKINIKNTFELKPIVTEITIQAFSISTKKESLNLNILSVSMEFL